MKVGIYVPWGSGDIIICTPVLKYKDLLWTPGVQVVWILQGPGEDILAHNPLLSEVRHASSADTWNHTTDDIIVKLRKSPDGDFEKGHPCVMDLDKLYFPMLWCNHLHIRKQIPYALIHREVFGYGKDLEVHPCMFFTPEEDHRAEQLIKALPFRFTVMLETAQRSGQSNWNHDTTHRVMAGFRRILGDCNFVFASHGQAGPFNGPGVADCSPFTIRQCIPIYNRCHAFAGVSSGISQATCSWTASPTVLRVDYVGAETISSKSIARGPAWWAGTEDMLLGHVENIAKQIKGA